MTNGLWLYAEKKCVQSNMAVKPRCFIRIYYILLSSIIKGAEAISD